MYGCFRFSACQLQPNLLLPFDTHALEQTKLLAALLSYVPAHVWQVANLLADFVPVEDKHKKRKLITCRMEAFGSPS